MTAVGRTVESEYFNSLKNIAYIFLFKFLVKCFFAFALFFAVYRPIAAGSEAFGMVLRFTVSYALRNKFLSDSPWSARLGFCQMDVGSFGIAVVAATINSNTCSRSMEVTMTE